MSNFDDVASRWYGAMRADQLPFLSHDDSVAGVKVSAERALEIRRAKQASETSQLASARYSGRLPEGAVVDGNRVFVRTREGNWNWHEGAAAVDFVRKCKK